MILQLDKASWQTFGRFRWKVALAAALTLVGQSPYLMAFAAWLAMMAWATTIFAMMRRRPYDPVFLNAWDEIAWLMFLSHGARLLHLAMN